MDGIPSGCCVDWQGYHSIVSALSSFSEYAVVVWIGLDSRNEMQVMETKKGKREYLTDYD